MSSRPAAGKGAVVFSSIAVPLSRCGPGDSEPQSDRARQAREAVRKRSDQPRHSRLPGCAGITVPSYGSTHTGRLQSGRRGIVRSSHSRGSRAGLRTLTPSRSGPLLSRPISELAARVARRWPCGQSASGLMADTGSLRLRTWEIRGPERRHPGRHPGDDRSTGDRPSGPLVRACAVRAQRRRGIRVPRRAFARPREERKTRSMTKRSPGDEKRDRRGSHPPRAGCDPTPAGRRSGWWSGRDGDGDVRAVRTASSSAANRDRRRRGEPRSRRARLDDPLRRRGRRGRVAQ